MRTERKSIMDMGLSFWMMKNVLKIEWQLHTIVNLLNSTESFTFNWLLFLCEFHLNFKMIFKAVLFFSGEEAVFPQCYNFPSVNKI